MPTTNTPAAETKPVAHTPGDWHAKDDGSAVYVGEGRVVALIFDPAWNGLDDEDVAAVHANATVVAAAPSLLVACRELLAIVRLQNGNLHDDTNAIQAAAEAAIAKAEGRAS